MDLDLGALATLILGGMPPVRWEFPWIATYDLPDGKAIQVEWDLGLSDSPIIRDWRELTD